MGQAEPSPIILQREPELLAELSATRSTPRAALPASSASILQAPRQKGGWINWHRSVTPPQPSGEARRAQSRG